MIPILYEASETQFKTNGLGRLTDAISCEVTEEMNGSYELQMEYPVEGIHYADIAYGRLIYAKPAEDAEPQPFEIYLITRPLDMKVTIHAEHISYRMKYIPVTAFTASDVKSALAGLKSHAVCDCPFTLETDKSASGNFVVENPETMRSMLADGDNTIATIYGGEWQFDKFNAKLCLSRGVDNGVTIRYGKNLTTLEQEESIEDMVTGIYPYWNGDDDAQVTLPEKVLNTSAKDLFPYPRVVAVDFSSNLEGTEITRNWTEQTIDPSTSRIKTEEKSETITVNPSADSLRQQAQMYIRDNALDTPAVNLKVEFVDLRKAVGEEDLADLETVHLCDSVTVEFVKLGVSAKAKVIKTEYDVLNEKYNTIEIGDAKATLRTMTSTTTAVPSATLRQNTSDIVQIKDELNKAKDELNKTKTGSKTLSLSNSAEATIFTMAELNTLFGLPSGTCNNKNTMVSAVNSDSTITTPITGCRYGDNGWFVVFAQEVNGSVSVNYNAQYLG